MRSTLVHEAELKDFEDYLLLSELIREVILRLINSKVKRYSDLDKVVFFEKEPGLSFIDYVEKYNMNVTDQVIIPEFDKRIKLWMYHPCKLEKKKSKVFLKSMKMVRSRISISRHFARVWWQVVMLSPKLWRRQMPISSILRM